MNKKIFLIVTTLTLVPFAALAANGIVNCDVCTINDFLGIIPRILDFIWKQLTVALAILFFLIGAVVLLTSGPNPEQRNLGKKIIMSSIIGMLLVYCSWLFVDLILKALGARGLG